jgi:endonuclease G, mitochondrial
MKPKPVTELPGRESRIASVLRSKDTRDTLAERASKKELSPKRGLAFSSEVVADHLSKSRAPAEDAEFFDSRRLSEAIILEVVRPVLFVRNGMFDVAKLPEIEAKLKGVRKAMIKPIQSVGRIELADHDTYDWCGTGWRIDDDLIVTNRHVVSIFAQRQGQTFKFRLNQLSKQVRAHIDFREEFEGIENEEFGIAEILWIADDSSQAPDIAIMRVKKDPGLPGPLSLTNKKISSGQEIAVIGYPAKDSRNDATVMSDVFQDIYDVKRFAPGEIVRPGDNTWYLTHDASTLGGNSGSVVLDLATREVVGLHFGGSFRKTNYAVKATVIKKILGRRFWVGVTGTALGVPTETFSETKRTLAAMKDRAGYDANFLNLKVNLPKSGNSHTVLNTGFAGNILPYTHFSIMMSQSRRFPIFTAENLDGALKIKLKRKDSWGFDPRIPKGAQIGHKEFYGPEPFDKGHMVRRENPGWGSTEAEARLGEDDTFVYTNAIPQMPQLNQRTWLSLEDYVLQNVRTEGFKVSVFTGPVFRSDDPSYKDIQVPTDFWKVVISIDAETGELLSSAYLLSQESLMPEEAFRFGPFKTYQVPLKRIETLADLKFPKAVRDTDVFGGEGISETVQEALYVEINSPEDIVLTKPRL